MSKFAGQQAINSDRATRTLGRPTGTAHRLVAETAAGMAAEVFDALMQRDDWWQEYKDSHPNISSTEGLQRLFVKKNTAAYLRGARTVLAQMLSSTLDPVLKDQIAEALLLDATLTRKDGQG